MHVILGSSKTSRDDDEESRRDDDERRGERGGTHDLMTKAQNNNIMSDHVVYDIYITCQCAWVVTDLISIAHLLHTHTSTDGPHDEQGEEDPHFPSRPP